MDTHNDLVRTISTSVRSFYERSAPFRIYHGSTNSTRPVARSRDNIVDISALNNFLSIDHEKKTALVEPNVPMDRLIQATLKENFIPPVVMEFAAITVGGGYAGEAGESSSFKHGLFDSTIVSIEMVLATGEIVHASATENADLFYGAAGAFGTLGVTTLLEIKLMPAKPYVELEYIPQDSISGMLGKIEELRVDDGIDYLDAIAYSPERTVVVSGRLSDHPSKLISKSSNPNPPIIHFTRPKDEVFEQHVEKQLQKRTTPSKSKTPEPWTELVPLADYLLRYDRGAFWGARYAFHYFGLPYNRATRWALSNWIKPRIMYPALHKSGLADRYVIQDLPVPAPRAGELVEFLRKETGIWPLWVCPLKIEHNMGSLHTRIEAFRAEGERAEKERWTNIGIWGPVPKGKRPADVNRGIEQKVRELRGIKVMYAHVYYEEDQFWEIYDREWYEGLREKWKATSLPSVYEKVKVQEQQPDGGWRRVVRGVWPLSAVYGIVCAGLFKDIGRDWLLDKKGKK